MTAILAAAPFGFWRAEDWARSRGATEEFVTLACLFWTLAPERGVDPSIAYAQSAKETGFGRFGGTDPAFSAKASMHNPAGIKSHDGKRTQSFADWPTGITAQLDHLALYAGARGYPRIVTPDPRHFGFLHGTAPTVEALGGRYAPSDDYGLSIVYDYRGGM